MKAIELSINIHLATSRDGINSTRVCRGEPSIRWLSPSPC